MRKISIATGALITLLLTSLSVFAQQTQSREDVLKQIETKRAELAALEKQFLAPSDEDKTTYAEFLTQADTGLVRLLPREKFDNDISRNKNRGLTIRGGGAYYSFARKTHEYGYGNDIGLEQGHLGTVATYGMLAVLGDVPLESVTFETSVAQGLATPASKERASNRGHVPLKLNSTYLVRSLDYRTFDVLVAFRVVRLDSDGSAIILWKLLKSFPVTEVAGSN